MIRPVRAFEDHENVLTTVAGKSRPRSDQPSPVGLIGALVTTPLARDSLGATRCLACRNRRRPYGTRRGKAIMAGAHSVQMVSALLQHEPDHIHTVRADVETLLERHEIHRFARRRIDISPVGLP